MMFAPTRAKKKPFVTGTRIYSCNLIRTDVEQRWRGRYNEDTILSLDMLTAGYQTILFYAYIQNKLTTQKMKGGNTDSIYANGTTEKSVMLARLYPEITKVVHRFGRIHHHVDYSQWINKPLFR